MIPNPDIHVRIYVQAFLCGEKYRENYCIQTSKSNHEHAEILSSLALSAGIDNMVQGSLYVALEGHCAPLL